MFLSSCLFSVPLIFNGNSRSQLFFSYEEAREMQHEPHANFKWPPNFLYGRLYFSKTEQFQNSPYFKLSEKL